MLPESLWPVELFARRGQQAHARAGNPLQLEGAGHAWRVETGAVDLFLSRATVTAG